MNKQIKDFRQFLYLESISTPENYLQNKVAALKALHNLDVSINESETLKDLCKATENHSNSRLSRIEEVSLRLVLKKLKHFNDDNDPYFMGVESFNSPKYLKLVHENAVSKAGEVIKGIKETLIKIWEKFILFIKSLFTKMKAQTNQIKSLKKKINKMSWENYLKLDFSDPEGIFLGGSGDWASDNKLQSRDKTDRTTSIIKSLVNFNEKFF